MGPPGPVTGSPLPLSGRHTLGWRMQKIVLKYIIWESVERIYLAGRWNK
jgi:hypothetical protein